MKKTCKFIVGQYYEIQKQKSCYKDKDKLVQLLTNHALVVIRDVDYVVQRPKTRFVVRSVSAVTTKFDTTYFIVEVFGLNHGWIGFGEHYHDTRPFVTKLRSVKD